MYSIEVCGARSGKKIEELGPFATMVGAHQGIIDHAGIVDLPKEVPYFAPEINVIQGWIIGNHDYQIMLAAR